MKNTFTIKKNKTIKYILKKGKYKSTEYLVIHYTKINYSDNSNNFAVCVSKKNGTSGQRTRLKRWARESYKILEDKLKVGNNIVVLYKKSATIDVLNFDLVFKSIDKCFKELKLYNE